ncbi:hypothetical protein ACWGJP_10605 [Microbacterium sp. NPDC055903]
MSNRRTRRKAQRPTAPLSFEAFTRELTKAADGDPLADPRIRDFLDEFTRQFDVAAVIARTDGLEMLRRRGGTR